MTVDLRGLRQVLVGQGGGFEGSVSVGLTAQGGAGMSGYRGERGPGCRQANVLVEEGELGQERRQTLSLLRDRQCRPGLRGPRHWQDGAPRHPGEEGLGVG